MPADFDSVFGDDDFNFDDDPIEEVGQDDTTVSQQADDDGFEDMFRQRAARTETSFDEMEADADDYFEPETSSSGGFSLGSFTALQRLIIIALILLDILAIGYGVLILTGNVG